METTYLFVYGTLRKDGGHAMGRWMGPHCDFVGAGWCAGRIYRVPRHPDGIGRPDDVGYPGLIIDDAERPGVLGDVFRVRQAQAVMGQLDEYELCGDKYGDEAEYTRELREIRLADGGLVMAWVYVYNKPVEGLEWIQSGDFLAG
ncbi:gamma-glutamylcyclotransferase [Planctomycetales bacterium ZRK34]|nr:gamma-glutamylcyclotransferase [Planctomycetales bacterium ZRK34]